MSVKANIAIFERISTQDTKKEEFKKKKYRKKIEKQAN